MSLNHGYQATGTNDGAKQVSVTRWNDAHAIDSDGLDFPAGITTPAAPAADTIRVFGREIANRAILAQVGPSGLSTPLQPLLGRNRVKQYQAVGNATTVPGAFGGSALSGTGTATASTVAVTNVYTRTRLLEYLVTTAATTAVAGFREAAAQHWLSSTAGLGGFFFVCRFGQATGVTTGTRRCFAGMSSSVAAPTDVQPSSQTNICGVGYDAADTNFWVMHNDGTGTATRIDTGIARPTADRTSMYELAMFAPPGGGQVVHVQLTNLATAAQFNVSISSVDLPAVGTMLAARGYASVGGTSSVIGFAFGQLYLETDD